MNTGMTLIKIFLWGDLLDMLIKDIQILKKGAQGKGIDYSTLYTIRAEITGHIPGSSEKKKKALNKPWACDPQYVAIQYTLSY